jgi:DNA-binding CsgD family transcriptional regulator
MGHELGQHFVMLCDWRGHCIWTSARDAQTKVGELIWTHAAQSSQGEMKSAFAKVVALREAVQLEVVDQRGARLKGWMWPLDSPDVAVCILAVPVPANLVLLTQRERDCLELLAEGIETREIARRLDVSVSTVHTHLQRTRTKLGLPSMEALISFAARYFYPNHRPLTAHSDKSS